MGRRAVLGEEHVGASAAHSNYSYKVDPKADTAAAHVLRFVGGDKTVLDVGAGPGSITKPMVELNKCRVSAVEFDANSCDVLRGFCDDVVQCDLNDHSWIDILSSRAFDVVVLADVLEHLYDPWTTLKLAAGLLNEQGSVVVSLPHASHAAVIACLLNNDFDYRDWGLLDRTHIRFFSMKNIEALFERAGLKIVDSAFVIRRPEESEFADAWAALPRETRAAVETGAYAHVYQVVVQAVPANEKTSLPVHSLLDRRVPQANKLKYIAFYLPQFHPIPENDLWWGKGFTEWTNVTKAQPLFPGHYQPHLPADLGFYDLRVREVQHEQINYAKHYGIDAFCFHFYWFAGRRILNGPLDDFLADPQADIDFCICWANENWTRRWDAAEHDVLLEQTYSLENDTAFMVSLLPLFADKRYIRVNGAPLLIVYRPQHMPDPRATAELWRQICRESGIGEIHLVAALTHGNMDYEQFGFDAGVQFPPHSPQGRDLRERVSAHQRLKGSAFAYRDIAEQYLAYDYEERRVYRTVMPSWDNTARVGNNALVVLHGTPGNYERWLGAASYKTVVERSSEDRLVFINAWNEWAEGCHLEPDRKYGSAFLESTLRVKSGQSSIDPTFSTSEDDTAAPSVETSRKLKRKKKPEWRKRLSIKKLFKKLNLR